MKQLLLIFAVVVVGCGEAVKYKEFENKQLTELPKGLEKLTQVKSVSRSR